MSQLGVALKEWAVICEALAQGRQALILRKGGIAETHRDFRLEHERFWLFPTYVHQQEQGIIDDYRPLLAQALSARPPVGVVRLQFHAEVVREYRVESLDRALAVAGFHGLSKETVQSRFHYREPGLCLLALRVYRADSASEFDDTPAFAGCKSWVNLGDPLEARGKAVLSEQALSALLEQLDQILGLPVRPG